MKYILQLDGSYFEVSEDSEYYKKMSEVTKDQRSVVFHTEKSKAVQEYLRKKSNTAKRKK